PIAAAASADDSVTRRCVTKRRSGDAWNDRVRCEREPRRAGGGRSRSRARCAPRASAGARLRSGGRARGSLTARQQRSGAERMLQEVAREIGDGTELRLVHGERAEALAQVAAEEG